MALTSKVRVPLIPFPGWGVPCVIVLLNVCFEYQSYGGGGHCFLRLDTGLVYGQLVPVIALVIATFALVEAAGAGSSENLQGATDVKIMQK